MDMLIMVEEPPLPPPKPSMLAKVGSMLGGGWGRQAAPDPMPSNGNYSGCQTDTNPSAANPTFRGAHGEALGAPSAPLPRPSGCTGGPSAGPPASTFPLASGGANHQAPSSLPPPPPGSQASDGSGGPSSSAAPPGQQPGVASPPPSGPSTVPSPQGDVSGPRLPQAPHLRGLLTSTAVKTHTQVSTGNGSPPTASTTASPGEPIPVRQQQQSQQQVLPPPPPPASSTPQAEASATARAQQLPPPPATPVDFVPPPPPPLLSQAPVVTTALLPGHVGQPQGGVAYAPPVQSVASGNQATPGREPPTSGQTNGSATAMHAQRTLAKHTGTAMVSQPLQSLVLDRSSRHGAKRASEASTFPCISLRKAHTYLKTRVAEECLPSHRRLLDHVLLGLAMDTRGLQGNGLADPGSFDVRIARLFKEMADRVASGQGPDAVTGGGLGGEVDGVEYWEAQIFRTIVSRRLSPSARKEVIIATGDDLSEVGRVAESHALYLVGGIEPGQKRAKERDLRLIGVHIAEGSLTAASFRDAAFITALQHTEVLELVRHPVRDPEHPDQNPDGLTMELLSAKLVYAAFLLDQGNAELAMAYINSIHDMVWPWIELSSNGQIPKITSGGPYSDEFLREYAAVTARAQAMVFPAPPPPPTSARPPVVSPAPTPAQAPPLFAYAPTTASVPPPPSGAGSLPLTVGLSSAPVVASPANIVAQSPVNVWSPAQPTPPPTTMITSTGHVPPPPPSYGGLDISTSLTAEVADEVTLGASYGSTPHYMPPPSAMAPRPAQIRPVTRYAEPTAAEPKGPHMRVNTEFTGTVGNIMGRSLDLVESVLGLFSFGRTPARPTMAESTAAMMGATNGYNSSYSDGLQQQRVGPPPMTMAPGASSGYYASTRPSGSTGRPIGLAFDNSARSNSYGHNSTNSGSAQPPPPVPQYTPSPGRYNGAYVGGVANLPRPVYNV